MTFDLVAESLKIQEAYCIEHNIPCKRRYTHEELQDAFVEVRAAHATLYDSHGALCAQRFHGANECTCGKAEADAAAEDGQPIAAEAVTDLGT